MILFHLSLHAHTGHEDVVADIIISAGINKKSSGVRKLLHEN